MQLTNHSPNEKLLLADNKQDVFCSLMDVLPRKVVHIRFGGSINACTEPLVQRRSYLRRFWAGTKMRKGCGLDATTLQLREMNAGQAPCQDSEHMAVCFAARATHQEGKDELQDAVPGFRMRGSAKEGSSLYADDFSKLSRLGPRW